MLIDIKSTLIMVVGMLYSIVILYTQGNGAVPLSFSEHQRNPLIMSIAIGLIIGGVIQTLPKLVQVFTLFSKKNGQDVKTMPFNKDYLVKLLAFVIVSCFVAYYVFSLSVLYWLILLALGFLFTIAIVRVRSETGMGLSIAAYIFIPVIGLMTKNLATTLILSGSMVLLTIQSSQYLEALTVARRIQVPSKNVTKYYLMGSIFGAVAGTVMLFYISALFTFGTESMPAPTAMAWGVQAQFVTGGSIPESINIPLILGAIVAGIVLSALKISATSLSMGLLLPMSSISIMCIGAGIARLMKKKGNPQCICSGLLLGDGLQFFIRTIFVLLH